MVGNNYRFGFTLVLIIPGLVIFFLSGCVDKDKTRLYDPESSIDLTEPVQENPEPVAIPDKENQIRVAIAPVISPEKSLEIYNSLVEYLGTKLNREPIFLRRGSYAEVNDLVRFQQCDIALVCTYAYIRGAQDFGMELLVAPRVKGDIHYHSNIIVPISSDASNLLDLKGKRFASADLMSTSGWLWPMLWLKNYGEDPENFFSEHLLSGSHDNSVFAVVSGLVDGAAVDSMVFDSMVEDDPEIERNIKIIMVSPQFGSPPIVVPSRIDPEFRQEILDTLVNMDEDPAGREILSVLDIDRFEVVSDDLYESVREAVAGWEGSG